MYPCILRLWNVLQNFTNHVTVNKTLKNGIHKVYANATRIHTHVGFVWLGIHGVYVNSSPITVDEGAPISKPYKIEGRFISI